MNDYHEFLAGKERRHVSTGIDADFRFNSLLFDWQVVIVEWALRVGKAAIFAECGLGKTPMQLEWARQVYQHTGSNILILAPLAVSKQTAREAEKFGIEVTLARSQDDVRYGINVTNYEMLHKFDTTYFDGVVLDESSILKAYSGKVKRQIIEAFAATRFKLACTATPSPNDHMELLNHSAFLDVMTSHEALAIWFVNDAAQQGVWRLKKHAERDFWRWVSQWAVAIGKPSDIGYSNNGFILPSLETVTHVVETDPSISSGEHLFRIPEMNATSYHREKRISAPVRAELACQLARAADGPVVIWCETNYEADEIMAILPNAVEVRGNHSAAKKEQAAIDFADGKIPILVSKPSLFGFGMNFQVCHETIFCGMSFSYETMYQAIRRFWRFGQAHQVKAHLIIGDGERDILATVQRKQADHEDMKRNMIAAVRESHVTMKKRREIIMDYDREEERGDDWTMILGDAVEEIRGIGDDEVHFSIFSPPFSALYVYSDSWRDMGNCDGDEAFFEHFAFVTNELHRVTMPGRLVAIHCKQMVNYKGWAGRAGLRDFRGDIIRAMQAADFTYHSEVCIWTDPVTEMQRTKSHGLLYKQLRKDSSYSRMGLPDYLVVFRKWVDGDEPDPEPVTHTKESFTLDAWQRYASPVWFDIHRTDVLNTAVARDDADEKHICPLQIGVADRAIELWSNPGDLVLSPFAGLGTEGVSALKAGRRFVGFELKESYYRQAVANLKAARAQLGLFEDIG